MPIAVFFSSTDLAVQARFERWLAKNPNGFYVNRKTMDHGVLHRVGCVHLEPFDASSKRWIVTKTPKVCATDRMELSKWAEREGVHVVPCAHCGP